MQDDKFNLADLVCTQTSGENWTSTGSAAKKCLGNIMLRKIDSEGAYGVEYKFYGGSYNAWYEGTRLEDDSNKIKSSSEVTIKHGEGMIVYTDKTAAMFTVAGSVKLVNTSYSLAKGYSFTGNCTPVEINLANIGCTQGDGSAWTSIGSAAKKCLGNIMLRKIDAEGAYGVEYKFYGGSYNAWYEGTRLEDDSNKVTIDSKITLKPGEGVIAYSDKTAALIVFPSPVSK
jgi:hypothetical protein